jgi:hypothetical protein
VKLNGDFDSLFVCYDKERAKAILFFQEKETLGNFVVSHFSPILFCRSKVTKCSGQTKNSVENSYRVDVYLEKKFP